MPNKVSPVIDQTKVMGTWYLSIKINNETFSVGREVADYTPKTCKPIYDYFVRVAPEFNPSGHFIIRARTHELLVAKIAKYPYLLVRGK